MFAPAWLGIPQVDIVWIALVCFGLAIASALLPWINAELMLLAVAGPLTSPTGPLVVVLAVTAGQLTGKSALYWLARRARLPPSARMGRAIERWRDTYERRPIAMRAVMLASATFGFPPFYLTTLVAGALRIGFGTFLAAGLLGRLLHFGAIAMVPGLVGGIFH